MPENRLDKVLAGTLNLSTVPADISQGNCPQWDSIRHLNLVIALEAEFAVTFEPEEIAAMRSREEILKILKTKDGV
ncbi:MAG: acyl carrier protein [Opitutales bacterium]|nr:acyl carrier protein [Opitutales bacterium]